MSEKKFTTPRLEHWERVDHAETFRKTLETIGEYGWQSMIINGDPQTRFAYTVGAYDTMKVPELIVVGLTNETGHASLHRAIQLLRERVNVTEGRHRNIVGEVEVEFRPVAMAWIAHVMCRTQWYYGGENIPVLQIIYPDLEGHFQWDSPFEEYFRQPLLQTAPPVTPRDQDFWAHNDPQSSLFDWKFPDPPHTRVYLSQTVQDREESITYVSHDAIDRSWQFLGDKMAGGGGPVISCFHHPIDWDPSLKELHDLPVGWYAVRDKPGEPWQRFEHFPDEAD